MVAHDAQHRVRIRGEAREGSELGRHFGGGAVAHARHQGRKSAAERTPLVRIVSDAGRHQEPAEIGEAESQRTVLVGERGDLGRRELRHQHRGFEHDRPQPHSMFVGRHIDPAGRIAELHEVQRGEIAGRVVEEHVFRAIVDHEAVGDEVVRDRLGKVEHGFLADVVETRKPILHPVRGGRNGRADRGERLGLRAARQETDLRLEHPARGLRQAQAMDLLHRMGLRAALSVRQHAHQGTRAAVAAEFRLDAEAEQEFLDLFEQESRRAVERQRVGLFGVVRDSCVRGEQAGQDRAHRRTVESKNLVREGLAGRAGVQNRQSGQPLAVAAPVVALLALVGGDTIMHPLGKSTVLRSQRDQDGTLGSDGAAISERQAQDLGEAGIERGRTERRPSKDQHVVRREVGRRDVAAVARQHLVIGRERQLQARGGREPIDRLSPGQKSRPDRMQLTVSAYDRSRGRDERIDPPQALRRRHQRIAGHARIRSPDLAARGAGVPIVDGGVELQPRIGRCPGRIADLVPQGPGR